MKARLTRMVREIFPALILAFVGTLHAQQTLSVDESVEARPLQAQPKSWKENMLERQLRGNVMKSFDPDSSINGVLVNPTPSRDAQESPAAKRRREAMEQAKFFIFMNPDSQSQKAAMDELMTVQDWETEPQMGRSPLERLYEKQMQRERSMATNRARVEREMRNQIEPQFSGNSSLRLGDSVQNDAAFRNSFDPARKANGGSSLFPDLFSSPSGGQNAVNLQARRDDFRQLLDSRSPGQQSFSASPVDSGRPLTSYGRMIESLNSAAAATPPNFPTRSTVVSPPVSTPPVSPSLAPSYQPAQRSNQKSSGYNPPTRKF